MAGHAQGAGHAAMLTGRWVLGCRAVAGDAAGWPSPCGLLGGGPEDGTHSPGDRCPASDAGSGAGAPSSQQRQTTCVRSGPHSLSLNSLWAGVLLTRESHSGDIQRDRPPAAARSPEALGADEHELRPPTLEAGPWKIRVCSLR